jgi:hypothetical protein
MSDSSAYAPGGADLVFDLGEAPVCQYVAVDFRDGRYGVFVIHRESREWWRLVAIFSTWERAERYAGVETDCAYTREEINLPGADPLRQEELIPAPAALPPEPPTALQSPLRIADDESASPYLKLWGRDYSQTLPLSDRLCERAECGYFIPEKRAEHKLTKYCSPECAEIVTKERALAKKAAAVMSDPEPVPEEAPTAPDPATTDAEPEADESSADTWTEERVTQLRDLVAEGLSYSEIGKRLGITKNAALGKANRLGLSPPQPVADTEQDQVARFIAENGVTKLPPDPRLRSDA